MAAFIQDRKADADRWSAKSKRDILALGQTLGLAFASHDDATPAHVAEAIADGVVLAEFPTTLEAARAARQAGMAVLMGAPNLVRGKSHNGNVSALDLARAGTLDVLSSDYVPFSLIQAAFLLPELHGATSLPRAIRMVTRRSAEAVGLTDRGALAPGLRADLVRVWRPPHGVPVVRSVWRDGQRVS
jgi:alpha-D-ribose 1-methylphosphonate 5-triphosphate diphosphatase